MMIKKTLTGSVVLTILLCLSFHSSADAQVQVVRGGSENPMVTVAKSTFYGALTGLLLGGALVLVTDGDDGDIFKWSFVGGTLGGFAMGMYHVATRPGPSNSMLHFDANGLKTARLPQPVLSRSRMSGMQVNVPILALSL